MAVDPTSEASSTYEHVNTDDLRPGLIKAALWATVTLIVVVRVLAAADAKLPVSAWFAAMLPYPPLFVLLRRPGRGIQRTASVLALPVLYAVPFLVFGWQWQWVPWTLAAAALCAFQGRAAWILFGLVLVGTFTASLTAGDRAWWALLRTAQVTNDGLAAFGPYALVGMVTESHATRDASRRLCGQRERRRLDDDLRRVVVSELRELCTRLDAVETSRADPESRSHLIGAAAETARRALSAIREAAGDYRRHPLPASTPIDSPATARRVLIGFFGVGVLMVSAGHLDHRSPWTFWLTAPCAAVVAWLLLARPPSPRGLFPAGLLLVGQYPLSLFMAWDLDGMTILLPYLAGVVLATVRPRLSWAAVGVLLAVDLLSEWYPSAARDSASATTGLVSSFVVGAWFTFSLLRLATLVTLLQRVREESVHEAVLTERTRIARDLHDVVSFSLTAIALKGELGRRMLITGAQGAEAHLAELPVLARRALAEVEALINDSLRLVFDQEVERTCGVLAAAGIRATTMTDRYRAVPGIDLEVAAVLREAVTNIVKHSRARSCTIAVVQTPSRVTLRVVNDGVENLDAVPRAGSGLQGMAERTGGRLLAGPLPPDRFEIIAEFATEARLQAT